MLLNQLVKIFAEIVYLTENFDKFGFVTIGLFFDLFKSFTLHEKQNYFSNIKLFEFI